MVLHLAMCSFILKKSANICIFLCFLELFDAINYGFCIIYYRFQHPNYDEGIGFTPNDFAVVQTTDIPSGANISPGTIATTPVNPEVDGAITGWGRYCGRSNYSAILVSSAERERKVRLLFYRNLRRASVTSRS